MDTGAREILAADIGGTTSRFGLFGQGPGGLVLLDSLHLPTASFSSFRDLLAALARTPLGVRGLACGRASFAVAGPVRQDRFCDPPNIPWDLDLDRDLPGPEGGQAVLVNDFVAQAHGCLTPAVDRAEVVQPGVPDPRGVLAVAGAGTGLGHCALVPLEHGGFLAVPSESGHADFPFVGEAEQGFARFLAQEAGMERPVAETVVSGAGLALVRRYLEGGRPTPREAAATLDPDSPAVAWFARFYGRVCRNYVLAVCATGGLVVSGGVAARSPVLVRHPAFLEEFLACVPFRDMLAAVPVRLNANQDTGLFGAARFGLALTPRPGSGAEVLPR